jgi:protein-L-isoaspartate(D-aspartate) O-methyltransferase
MCSTRPEWDYGSRRGTGRHPARLRQTDHGGCRSLQSAHRGGLCLGQARGFSGARALASCALGARYVPTPSRNPVYLYDDVVVAIIPERHLNNGQPSLHAALIASAAPRPGEHVVRVGAGVGYYTAILHRLVGRQGRVTAIEFDAGLAARLAANFVGVRNIRVVHGDGARVPFDSADVIYVNAGATKPAETWLDRLAENGRLILPLTAAEFPTGDVRHGAVFRIERHGSDFLAQRISGVAIFPCEGMRDAQSEAALAAAFEKGRVQEVTRLYRRDDEPAENCWLRGTGWSLAFR